MKPQDDKHSPPEPQAHAASTGHSADGQSPRSDAPPSGSEHAAGGDSESQLRRENADLKDRLLRALAETENTRRRAERDLNDMRQYAVSRFAGDIISVADNLERAIASLPAHGLAQGSAIKTFIEGVELTEKELQRTLEKHGIRKLDPLGERFDPNFHEALFEAPDPTAPSKTVTTVVQPGYAIGARSLRPAKVGISSGGPQVNPAVDQTGDKNGSRGGRRD